MSVIEYDVPLPASVSEFCSMFEIASNRERM